MKEINSDIKKLASNDWDPEATKLIEKNFEFNDISLDCTEVTAMDAIDLMYEKRINKDFYDVIDLDPYGTAVPFLDSSIQALEDGGLMCVTFTDTAVLCAWKPHACFYRYGAVTSHKRNCHEFALRLVLHTIATTANRYQRQIIPLLSLTADFYLRLFIKVVKKPILCHESIINTSYVFQCTGCQAFHLHSVGKSAEKKSKRRKSHEEMSGDEDDKKLTESQKQSIRDHKHNTKFSINNFTVPSKCEICDSPFMVAGPIWSSEIHDLNFINSLLDSSNNWNYLGTHKRITETLQGIQKEVAIGNYPLSFEFDKIISEIKAPSISRKSILSAFKSLNYDLAQTYYSPSLYKTNAPHKVVYDIFKAWKQKNIEGKDKPLTLNCSPIAKAILSKPISVEPNFKFQPDKIDQQLKEIKVKYNTNPPNWGPGTRAASKAKKAEKKALEKNQEEEESKSQE